MKRNLLTAVAMLVSAFFIGTTIAEAADIKIGGQIRPRFEVNEQGDTDDDTSARYFVSQRHRLNFTANVNDETTAFLQPQAWDVWGTNCPGTTGNDNCTDVGMHQAWFTLKNFATLPVDLKVGRQEFTLGGHRIIGSTNWAQGATAHDAVRLTHSSGDHTIGYFYSYLAEQGNVEGKLGGVDQDANQAQVANDVQFHLAFANFKGVLGGALELYWAFYDDHNGSTVAVEDVNVFHTLGFRQAGKLYGIDYRAEYYYQTGTAQGFYNGAGFSREATDADGPGDNAFVAPSVNGGMDAWMWGVRVGKHFKNVMWKPKLTFWVDQLSGNDDDDVRGGGWGAFNTLFDTGHKFYGFMDLIGPGGGATTDSTGTLGLQDYAVKLAFQPIPASFGKWTVKVDYHHFAVQNSPNGNTRAAFLQGTTVGDTLTDTDTGLRNLDNHLGDEIDFTFVNKYNANTKIVIGYSQFWGSNTFYALEGDPVTTGAVQRNRSGAQDQPQWAYVMFDVKF